MFNYENLGMVKVDFCGRVKWRLARMTHHALYRDDAGHLWALDHIITPSPTGVPDLPPAVQRGRGDRAVRRRQALAHLLGDAPAQGQRLRRPALHVVDRRQEHRALLRLPAHQRPWRCSEPDAGGPVQARRRDDLGAQHQHRAGVRPGHGQDQAHDDRPHRAPARPDFMDGSTISVFDNHNISKPFDEASSRILIHDFKTKTDRIFFQGTPSTRSTARSWASSSGCPTATFCWERMHGRALELDPQGRIVWGILQPHRQRPARRGQRRPARAPVQAVPGPGPPHGPGLQEGVSGGAEILVLRGPLRGRLRMRISTAAPQPPALQ
ncbi:MAG: hypothetical protein WDM92_07255 [Caulobacteraceae bacterium]